MATTFLIWQVDVWEGGCPTSGDEPGPNPCVARYAEFGAAAAIGAFSQQPTTARNHAEPSYVLNTWLHDGTPLLLPPASLWYPQDKGFCARGSSAAEMTRCVTGWLREAASQNSRRPLFVLAYGVDGYVDVAAGVRDALAKEGFEVVGAQSMAALARAAAPASVETA